jgi:hypothetical protein
MSTDEMNKMMYSMKDGEVRHFPEYDLTIKKQTQVNQPLVDIEGGQERAKRSKVIVDKEYLKKHK